VNKVVYRIGVVYANSDEILWVRQDWSGYYVGHKDNATEFKNKRASLRKIKRSWVGSWYKEFVVEEQQVTTSQESVCIA